MRIDLHTHTTASDGTLPPRELVAFAIERGLDVLGITDHDTVAGIAEAVEAAGDRLEIVPGIEISTRMGDRSMHMLGYFIDPAHDMWRSFEEERARARRERLERVVARLAEAGLAVSMEEVEAQTAPGTAPGRPHLARVLVEKGYAPSVGEAFRLWLIEGRPGYVPYEKPEAAEAARMIEEAGGIPVIAHAALDRLDPLLDRLVDEKGLKGIEVYHSRHDARDRDRYLAFAKRRGLLVTGGSDFHRRNGSEGGMLGDPLLPPEHLERLKAYRASRAS